MLKPYRSITFIFLSSRTDKNFSKVNLSSHIEDHTCHPRDNTTLNYAQSFLLLFYRKWEWSSIIWTKAPGLLQKWKSLSITACHIGR